jgi:hypothetical protein
MTIPSRSCLLLSGNSILAPQINYKLIRIIHFSTYNGLHSVKEILFLLRAYGKYAFNTFLGIILSLQGEVEL